MESLTTAALEWDIIEKPIFANNKQVVGYKGIFRNDNGQLLNIAKSSYTPTHNEKFIEVTEKLHDITGFPIENYYDVEGGKKVLSFLKCTDTMQVCGHEFKDYLMIGNSFDGSTGFFIGNSNIMVRCSNRFSRNFRQLQVNHTKNNSLRIDGLVQYFDMFMKQRTQLFEKMEQLSWVKIDDSIKDALVERLTRMNDEEKLGNEGAAPAYRPEKEILFQISMLRLTENVLIWAIMLLGFLMVSRTIPPTLKTQKMPLLAIRLVRQTNSIRPLLSSVRS